MATDAHSVEAIDPVALSRIVGGQVYFTLSTGRTTKCVVAPDGTVYQSLGNGALSIHSKHGTHGVTCLDGVKPDELPWQQPNP